MDLSSREFYLLHLDNDQANI